MEWNHKTKTLGTIGRPECRYEACFIQYWTFDQWAMNGLQFNLTLSINSKRGNTWSCEIPGDNRYSKLLDGHDDNSKGQKTIRLNVFLDVTTLLLFLWLVWGSITSMQALCKLCTKDMVTPISKSTKLYQSYGERKYNSSLKIFDIWSMEYILSLGLMSKKGKLENL